MKVYNEEDYLMLSGIQHFAFCPRQWALIHIENQWEENVRTVEGNIMHKRAHDGPQIETRKNLVVSRQMKVYSKYLGISGICDVVEFKKCKKGEEGVHLYGREGLYKVHPVEYKKGEYIASVKATYSTRLSDILDKETSDGIISYTKDGNNNIILKSFILKK